MAKNRLFGLGVNVYVRNRFLGSESSESIFWLKIKILSSESNLGSKLIFGSNIGIWLRIRFWAQILSFWVFDSESIFGIRIGFWDLNLIFGLWLGTESNFELWIDFGVEVGYFGHRIVLWPRIYFWLRIGFLVRGRSQLTSPLNRGFDPPLPPVSLMLVFHILDYLPLLSLFDKKNKW